MRMRRLGALAFSALLAAGLAACGDDDGGDGDALEDVDATDEGDGGGDDEEPDLGELGLEGECEVFAEAALAFSGAFGGGDSDADFGTLADAMQAFADDAPDEIADDLEVLADAYREFDDALGDVDLSDPNAFTDPEVQAALAEAGEVFNDPEVVEANENVTAFTEANCQAEG